MTDLATWYLTQLAADEAGAEALLFPPPGYYDKTTWGDELRRLASHVMEDAEAKRKVVARLFSAVALVRDNPEHPGIFTFQMVAGAMDQVVRLLATAYTDRPGYDSEWVPGDGL